jgi:hypothetical protein
VLTDPAETTSYIDYTISVKEGDAYDEVSLAGRYYAFDHGYVIISTVTPTRVHWDSIYPSSGTLKFTGAGQTWATLTFISGGHYRIDLHDGEVFTGVF